jgi:hypothetical protein
MLTVNICILWPSILASTGQRWEKKLLRLEGGGRKGVSPRELIEDSLCAEKIERSGPVYFFERDGLGYERNISLRGTTSLPTFSTKHHQKWNGMTLFYLTPKPNTTLVWTSSNCVNIYGSSVVTECCAKLWMLPIYVGVIVFLPLIQTPIVILPLVLTLWFYPCDFKTKQKFTPTLLWVVNIVKYDVKRQNCPCSFTTSFSPYL